MSKSFQVFVFTVFYSALLGACGQSNKSSDERNASAEPSTQQGLFYLVGECDQITDLGDVKYDAATRLGYLVEDEIITRIGIHYGSSDCSADTLQGWSRYWVYKDGKFSRQDLAGQTFDWRVEDGRLFITRFKEEDGFPAEETPLDPGLEIGLKVLDYTELSNQSYSVRVETTNLQEGALPKISCWETSLELIKPRSEGPIFTFRVNPNPNDDRPRVRDHCSVYVGFSQGPNELMNIIGFSEEFVLDFRARNDRS
jgi:hypothetical protein